MNNDVKREGVGKERIKSYKELRVYQAAMDAAMQIFELTKGFPLKRSTRWSIRCGGLHALSVPILEKHGERGAIRLIS